MGSSQKARAGSLLYARETQWLERPGRCPGCPFEGAGFEEATAFHQFGDYLTLPGPGEPMATHLMEADQEDWYGAIRP